MKQEKWEEAFNTLDKRVFSVDAIGGYDFDDILEQFVEGKDAQILDYGCGKGQQVERLLSQGYEHVYGTDPSQNLLKSSTLFGSNLKELVDGTIPFDDNSFDFVFCSGVLHHIDWSHFPHVLNEIKRVLKNNGHFVFIEPRDSIWRRLGHLVVLSPLSRLNKDSNALAECLRGEWPTYYPWLKRERKEFIPLCQKSGFTFIKQELKMFTTIGVIKNG